MRPRLRLSTLVLPLLALPSVLAGNGVLYTESVSYCAEAKAVIVEEFDIAYHQSNGSVVFTFSLASVEANLNVSANIYLNAYGIDIVNQTVDLCSYFEGVICPLPQVNFTGRLNLLVVVYPKLVQVTVPTPFPNPTPPRSRASPTAFPTSRLMLAWSLSEMGPERSQPASKRPYPTVTLLGTKL